MTATPVWRTRAAAKLNLTLEILGKRDDGFHDLSSLTVSLDLADDVRLQTGGDQLTVTYRDDQGRPISIETRDDIIVNAWSILSPRHHVVGGASVEVVKRIPVTSGLGGGSTDAAAFLRLARRAWSLPLSDHELCDIGAEVGSDVAACLIGGAVEMSGRGERVSPLDAHASDRIEQTVLLHRPEIPVPANKTATMYRSLRSSDFRDGSATRRLIERWSSGQSWTQDDCVNSFDLPAREVVQGLSDAWRRMGGAIAKASMELDVEPVTPLLAGAGPTLFAVLRPDVAQLAAAELSIASRSSFTRVSSMLSRTEATAIDHD